MEARTRKTTLSENWKEKIQTSMLLNRVNNHALGQVEMTSSQLDAAKFLLNKTISNAPTETVNDTKMTHDITPEAYKLIFG